MIDKMKSYFQLFRIHHWIKNILVFIPLFFSSNLLNIYFITNVILGFVSFSLLSSVVYIINDIRDIEKDRLHTTKCHRPLASGKILVHHAIIVLVFLFVILIILIFVSRIQGNHLYNLKSIGLLLLYVLLNIGYSFGLKNVPIADVTILASGYVIRIIFGSLIIGGDISVWLYLVVTMGAFYLGLGKRRNEITGNEKGTRRVFDFYSHNFLDKNMYVCQTLCIVFYALWTIDLLTIERFHTFAFVYTIPLIFIILLKYSLNIETVSDGDPVSVLLNDKILLLLCCVYIICAFCIIYLSKSIS